MPQPPAYERQTDFAERDGDDTDNSAINIEFDAVAQTAEHIRNNLSLLQQDDGKLKGGIVTPEALSQAAIDVLAGAVDSRVFLAQQAAGSAITSAQTANAAKGAAEGFADEAGLSQIASALNAEGAAASRTAIDERIYPGVYAVAPVARPSGAVIQNGDEYVDGATSRRRMRIAGAWVDYDAASSANAESSLSSKNAAGVSEANAAAQAGLAATAKAAAELARDAAMATGKVYATTAAGLAATTTTQYFSVPSPDSAESLILYLNSAGAAVEQKRYPSAEFLSSAPLGAAWAVVDGAGNAAIEILDDGTFRAAKLQADTQAIGNSSLEDALTPGYVWTVRDAAGNVAAGITNDGRLDATLLTAPGAAIPLVERFGGVYTNQLNYINGAGQSLAMGGGGAETTTQEYDNIGFAWRAVSPVSALPLATTNATGHDNQESPLYGTLGSIKYLILNEQGLAFGVNDYQLLGCNNGNGGAPIDEIRKGGVRGDYENAITQVQSGYNLATSTQRTFAFAATTWTQGESDLSMSKDTYKAKLKQLALDFNTDGKAITGQKRDVLFISYQLSAYGARDTVAPAQLEASEEVPYIKVAAPIYFLDFLDGTHLTAASYKWLGGYYGLVYKRVLIDGKEWQPLKPVQHTVLGNTLDLYFNKEGLVFDTALMPAQANQGFTAFDGAGIAVVISSVAIIKPNRVRLTFATPPQAGWSVKYGHINVVGKTNYNGGGGNLRDAAGDRLIYNAKPMHNWSVIFSRTL